VIFTKAKIQTDWAPIPETPTSKNNGRTHGVYVLNSGSVLVFHQAENAFLDYSPDAKLLRQFGGKRWLGAHGLTVLEENGEEFLWVTDELSGDCAKLDLDGNEIQSFKRPHLFLYNVNGSKPYIPSAIFPNPENGDVWISDGYGAYYLHRYKPDGEYIDSINEIDGAGKLFEPHGFSFHQGKQGTELWIADRINQRVLVCDTNGKLLRKTEKVHSPCSFAFFENYVAVCELFTGIKIFDTDSLELISEIGKNPEVNPRTDEKWFPPKSPEGWPNTRGTEHLKADCFNSPHQAAFDQLGNLYVVEWIIGGRISKVTFD